MSRAREHLPAGPPVALWRKAALLAGGAGLCACFARISLLSSHFVYGQGHEQRPIVAFVLWMCAAFACFALALAAVLRGKGVAPLAGDPAERERWPWWGAAWMLLVALAARAVMLPSHPIQEIDWTRYAWDGAVVLEGGNPYRFAPREVHPGDGETQYAPEDEERLERLILLRASSPRAQQVFDWIEYEEVRTVYPPLAQALFAAAAWLEPFSVVALRALFFLCEAATVLVLLDLLRRLRLSPLRALVFAWSPLAIKEAINSPHVDALTVLAIACAAWAWVAEQPKALGLALGLGVLAKFAGLILLPAALVALWRRRRTDALWCAGVFAATVAAGYAPFVPGSGGHLFDGLFAFATEWKKNSGLYALLEWAAGALAGTQSEWSVFGSALPVHGLLARAVAGTGMAATVAACALWPARPDTPKTELLARWLISLAAVFLLAPTGNPWYAAWMIPLLAILPVRGLIVLTGVLPLYYLWFSCRYHDAALQAQYGWSGDELFALVRWVEFLPVCALLALDALRVRRKRRPESPSQPGEVLR